MPSKPTHEVELRPRCKSCTAVARPGHVLCDVHHAEVRLASARRQLVDAAADAVDTLLQLAQSNTVSADVRLKATNSLLDRAGLRGGVEISVSSSASPSPAEIIKARLEKLRGPSSSRDDADPMQVVDEGQGHAERS